VPVIRVVTVMAMTPNPGADGGVIKTDTTETLTVTRRKDWTTLEMGFVRGWPMAVKRKGTNLLLAWPADADDVRAVGSLEDPGERLAVDLMNRQTMLYLNRSGFRFRHLLEVLEEALLAKTPVSVAVAPGDDVIEDVRPKSQAT
jgi:hypothetical protein